MIRIILSLFLFILSNTLFAQIFSTSQGGYWGDTLTWVGHKIPTKDNDVVINGPVTGSGQCYNLINEWELKRANIEIFGDLINRGGIVNTDEGDQSGAYTSLIVHGDITNKELIRISSIYLSGEDGHSHYIESTDTATFVVGSFKNAQKNRCHLLLKDDMMVQNTTFNLGEDSKIELEGHNLLMFGSSLWYSLIEGDGDNFVEFNLGSSLVLDSKLKDLVLKGRVNCGIGIKYSSKFSGTIINEGVLQDSLYGASSRIVVDGLFINKGTIQDNPLSATDDYRSLVIDANYDLYNQGTWKNGYVNLTGDVDQNLYFYNDVNVENFAVTDTVGKVIAQTDLNFHNSVISGNYASILMGGKKYYNDGANNYLYRVNLFDAVLDGSVQAGYDNAFRGTTVNNGSLTVFGGNSNTISIYDNFINNGIITKSIKDGRLFINAYGNIENNGIWENYRITFVGNEDQVIATTKPITVANIANNNNGKLVAGSDLMFQDVKLDLNQSVLEIGNEYSLTFIGTVPSNPAYILDGKVELNGNDLIMNDNSYVYSYIEINQPNIVGTVSVGSSVTFSGEVNITDTLTTRRGASSTLDVNGNITNHGVIINRDDLARLSIKLTGNLINLGKVDLRLVELTGAEEDQNIMLSNNQTLKNTFRFYDDTEGSSWNWTKDGEVISGKAYKYWQFDSLSVNEFGTYQCSTNVGLSRKINVITDSLSVDFTADTTLAVIGDSIKFLPTIFGIVDSVEWNFGDGLTSNELEPVHQYNKEGIYTVSLFVSNGFGSKVETRVDYINVTIPVGIEEDITIPSEYSLRQNYPNPFNPTTSIGYSVPEFTSSLTIKVYDMLGQLVKVLVNKAHQPGNYKVNFNASNLSSGLYIYRIESAHFINTKKMMLLR